MIPDSWLILEARLAPVFSVVIVKAVTRVLGSETVDDCGDGAAESTIGSKGSFSSITVRCGGSNRASSSTTSVFELERWDDTVATSIGRDE